MPWAHAHPEPLEATVSLLRQFRASFDGGADFVYGIFEPGEERVLGGGGLHTRVGAGALEIGYWIRADAIRQGFATEAAAALTCVAFELGGVNHVEVHVEPANEPSLEGAAAARLRRGGDAAAQAAAPARQRAAGRRRLHALRRRLARVRRPRRPATRPSTRSAGRFRDRATTDAAATGCCSARDADRLAWGPCGEVMSTKGEIR